VLINPFLAEVLKIGKTAAPLMSQGLKEKKTQAHYNVKATFEVLIHFLKTYSSKSDK
jgi:hypothetical protein